MCEAPGTERSLVGPVPGKWFLTHFFFEQPLFMRSITILLILVGFAPAALAKPPQLEPLTRDFKRSVRPFLDAYCLGKG